MGSWLTPALCLLIGKDNVIVMDGDKLEANNLNRQLFTRDDIGRFKAEALADKYGCGFRNEWFSYGARAYRSSDVLICAADNHPARAAVLEVCDYHKCVAIIAGNETYSAEAYAYLHQWKDSPIDPRTYYPEILMDASGDPRRGAIGCTGEAQEATPQLVVANMMAASLAMRMFEIWVQLAGKLDEITREYLPYRLTANQFKLETHRICDVIAVQSGLLNQPTERTPNHE